MPVLLQRNFPRESRIFLDRDKDFHSSNGSENETLLGSRTPAEFIPIPEQPRRFSKTCNVSLIVVNIILLLLNAACLLAVTVRGAQWFNRTLSAVGLGRDSHVAIQILSPSPAEEVVEYQLRRFTDVMSTGEADRMFVGDAGEKTDKFWDDIIDEDKYFAVDHDTFARVNGNPDTGVRLPGENSDKFIGSLQWAHQLHCLNIIRQSTWFDIGHYRHMHHFRNKTDEIIIAHTKHCLDRIRQVLQCNGDTSLLTYNWVRGYEMPKVAPMTLQSCQNLDRLREWQDMNDISHLITHLERPKWVMSSDPEVKTPNGGRKGPAEVQHPPIQSNITGSIRKDTLDK
ncbi:hypothetical protein GGI35DRAFT_454359 [Trichoderma velutinum]